MEYCAVLMLDNRDNRPEYSVVYANNVWSDLQKLLEAPAEVMLAKTAEGSPAPWKLNYPLNVLLEPMNSRANVVHSGRISELIALSSGNLGGELESLSRRESFASPEDRATKALDLTFLNGGFIAEFAINTSTLIIRYLAPPDVPAPIFDLGHVQPYTLAVLDEADLTRIPGEIVTDREGQLHADIDGLRGNREKFIMDYLSQPERFLSHLSNAQGTRTSVAFSELRPGAEIKAGEAIGPVSIKPALGALPRISVEYPGPSVGCCDCVDLMLTRRGNELVAGMMVVKCYRCDEPKMPPL